MKMCPYCGSSIQDTAKKCRFCGEWLVTPQPSSAKAPLVKETPRTPSSLDYKEKRSSKSFLIIAVSVAFIGILAFFLSDFFQKDNNLSTKDISLASDNVELNSYSFVGHLESSTGIKYAIDMEIVEDAVVGSGDIWEVSGSYHYNSQSSDKRIPLFGTVVKEKNGNKFFILVSQSQTERFELSLNTYDGAVNGQWRKYNSPESCQNYDLDYISLMIVSLHSH